MNKKSSKRQLRPTSHRRRPQIPPTLSQPEDLFSPEDDFYDDGMDHELEVDDDESLWDSDLEFEDGEEEDREARIVEGVEVVPEMRRHFGQIGGFDIDQREWESKSPDRYERQGGLKGESFKSAHPR